MRVIVLTALVLASAAVFGQDFQARQHHVAAALAALKMEQAKQGHDCAQAKNQYDDTMCTAEVAQAADKNLATFYDNLKAILGDDKNLEDSQKAWLEYRKQACDAIYEFYKGGTIRNSAQARCEIRLTRERMGDLDALYEMPLHH